MPPLYLIKDMKKTTILITILFLTFSCSSGNQAGNESASGVISIDSLKSEVLFVHDEVMPKMGELRKASKDLRLWADSLMELDSARANMLNSLAEDIAEANESMMAWMRAYEPDFDGTEEEIRAYFEAQKVSIQKVRDDMEGSLARGLEAVQK